MLYKKRVLKNFSKFTDKHKKQSSTGVLSNDVLKKIAKYGVYFCMKLQTGILKLSEAAIGDAL